MNSCYFVKHDSNETMYENIMRLKIFKTSLVPVIFPILKLRRGRIEEYSPYTHHTLPPVQLTLFYLPVMILRHS